MKLLLLFIVRINILILNKGSEKGSDSIDLYCNVLNLSKRKKRLKSAFSFCIDSY